MLEHATPEQFFVDKNQCGKAGQPVCQQAISAVKALQIAAQEGQKIYTITQANLNSALPRITAGKYVFEEIQNAVAAGKEVTIHERPIHAFGWSGSGYSVVDPETGAGAYMIEGGANGSWWSGFAIGAAATVGMTITAIIAATPFGVLGIAGGIMAAVIFAVLFSTIILALTAYSIDAWGDENMGCFMGGFGIGSAVTAIVAAVFTLFGGKATIKNPFVFGLVSLLLSLIGIYLSSEIPSTDRPTCFKG